MVHDDLFLYSLLQHEQLLGEDSACRDQVNTLFEGLTIDQIKQYEKWLKKGERYSLWKNASSNDEETIPALLPNIKAQQIDLDRLDLLVYSHEPLDISQQSSFPVRRTNEQRSTALGRLQKALLPNLETTTVSSVNIYYQIQRHGWSIPHHRGSAYISLFETIKNRAAWIQCFKHEQCHSTYPYLLLCGDLAGIQSFIYDIHSNKAAKSLKGRSFYLQYLLDYITYRIVGKCTVSIANIIYSSGGKFFLLLPNTEDVQRVLEELELDVMQYLYQTHQDRLYFCMDWVPFGVDDQPNQATVSTLICPEEDIDQRPIQDFGALWKQSSYKAAQKKQRRLHQLLVTQPSFTKALFQVNSSIPINHPSTQICAVTGEAIVGDAIKQMDDDGSDPIYISKHVYEQIEIGEQLIKSAYYCIDLNAVSSSHFEPKKGIGLLESALASSTSYWKDFNGAKYEVTTSLLKKKLNPLGDHEMPFVFYGGNAQAIQEHPTLPNQSIPKDYVSLCTSDGNGAGFNKLGVLRMDVDDLSHLFTTQLRDLGHTLAAYSHLSHLIHWFFAGHLNYIRQHSSQQTKWQVDFSEHLNIQYAGGDDLFVVGRWKEVLAFAYEVRRAFSDFTGGTRQHTISGGMVAVQPKYPIAKAAELAEEALEQAKNYDNGKKNAFCFERYVVSWDKEFDFAWQLHLQLIKATQELGINKGFLYKLLAYKQQKDAGDVSWYWQSAYLFQRYQRFAKREQKPKVAELFKALKEGIVSGAFKYENGVDEPLEFSCSKRLTAGKNSILDLCCLAAIWTNYSLRGTKQASHA